MTSFLLKEAAEIELGMRNLLVQQIFKITTDRCNIGYGKVPRGCLFTYIYFQLGFHGRPGNPFFKYLNQVFEELGFRSTIYEGKRIIAGLSWKNEEKKDWRLPKAKDLPHFNGKYYSMDGQWTE